MKRPGVGVGVILLNEDDEILVGKRKGSHAPYYSIPGGHLELGESFEAAARKEVLEETGLILHHPKVFCVSNNLETYHTDGLHYVSVNLWTKDFEGIPQVLEKDKCEGWEWVSPDALPEPHFEASRVAVACFLEEVFYLKKISLNSKI